MSHTPGTFTHRLGHPAAYRLSADYEGGQRLAHNGSRYEGKTARVRLVDVRRSFALAEPVLPATTVDMSEPI